MATHRPTHRRVKSTQAAPGRPLFEPLPRQPPFQPRPSPGPSALPSPEPQPFSTPAARPTLIISEYGVGDAPKSAPSRTEQWLAVKYSYCGGYGSTRQLSESPYSFLTSPTSPTSPEGGPNLVYSPLSQVPDPIRRFQENRLREEDEGWHCLVPEEARASLPEEEVKRQGVIFEVIKSEKEYVADLEALQDVFLTPLFNACPPIIDSEKQAEFRKEVFFNFDGILKHERRFLTTLYERQQEQHPIITSVADIILEAVFAFRSDYESYMKHYPLAEASHRRELTRSEAYKTFLSDARKDPRVRKHDLITFISRPFQRLPRLKLILERVQECTPEDHEDHKTMSLVLTMLSDFLKSIEPAAKGRVKCLTLRENLVFRKTELIDLDLYGETRTVVHEGRVGRKEKPERLPSFSRERWLDNSAKLLDHYFLLTEERAAKGPGKGTETNKYYVNSRPIPLDFLRLGSFIDPPDQREEEITAEKSFSARFSRTIRPMYPFTVRHAGNHRLYTLYVSSDKERSEWKEVLEETKKLRDVYMDDNKLFAFSPIQDGRFRTRTKLVPSNMANDGFTGRIISVAAFRSQEYNFLAIATEDGIYVGQRDKLDRSERVLKLPNVARMTALPSHDRFVLLFEKTLLSYSLKLLASAALGQTPLEQLEQTMETLAPQHKGHVAFFRVGSIDKPDYLVYGTPNFHHTLLVTPGVSQLQDPDPASLPAIAYSVEDITALDTDDYKRVITVPDFSKGHTNTVLAALKSKCGSAKTLGIVKVNQDERLLIYDEHGCYIDKYERPIRNCKSVLWEIRAISFSYRDPYLLLFGEHFIEIRHAPTGQFKQMVKMKNIRLLDSGGRKGSLFLMSQGKHNDEHGKSWALIEGQETAPLEVPKMPPDPANALQFSPR